MNLPPALQPLNQIACLGLGTTLAYAQGILIFRGDGDDILFQAASVGSPDNPTHFNIIYTGSSLVGSRAYEYLDRGDIGGIDEVHRERMRPTKGIWDIQMLALIVALYAKATHENIYIKGPPPLPSPEGFRELVGSHIKAKRLQRVINYLVLGECDLAKVLGMQRSIPGTTAY